MDLVTIKFESIACCRSIVYLRPILSIYRKFKGYFGEVVIVVPFDAALL